MKRAIIVFCFSLTMTAGCGSMPKLTVSYYLPKAQLAVTVTQTGTCSTGDLPVLTTDVTLTPNYTRGERREFDLSGLGSGPAKADATFQFYDDGRLKSINASQTGQAGEALTAILSLADVLLLDYDPAAVGPACTFLRTKFGADKALTIVYRGAIEFDPAIESGDIELKQMSVPQDTLDRLRPIFGEVIAAYDIESSIRSTPRLGKHEGPRLRLVEPALADLAVIVLRGEKSAQFTGQVWVPQHGQEYALPIQKSPIFGTNEFEVSLSEAGRITKLRYSGASAGTGILDALSDTASALQGETTKEKAERIEAEADLIFQQQRLVRCQVDPTTCSEE